MASKSGGSRRGSAEERHSIVLAICSWMTPAENEQVIPATRSISELARRAGVNRSALTHRNLDLAQLFQNMQGPGVTRVEGLASQNRKLRTKLDDALKRLEDQEHALNDMARLIRLLQMHNDAVTPENVTAITQSRDARTKRKPLPPPNTAF